MPHINQQTKTEKKIACNYAKCHTRIHRHLIATNNNAGDKNHSHVRAWVSTFRVQNMATIGHLLWVSVGAGVLEWRKIESNRIAWNMEWNGAADGGQCHQPILAEIQYASNRFWIWFEVDFVAPPSKRLSPRFIASIRIGAVDQVHWQKYSVATKNSYQN